MTTNGNRPINETVVVADNTPVRRVSWGAVLAGSLIALMVLVLINLLILGIVTPTINPATEAQPFSGIGTGTAVGLIISNVLALFAGGYIAGRLAGLTRASDGLLHGLLTWGVVTLVSFLVLSTAAGRLVSGVSSAVSQGLSLAGQGLSAVAPGAAQAVETALEQQGVNLSTIQQEAQQLLAQTGDPQLQAGDVQQEAQQAGQDVQSAAADIAQNPQQAGQEINQLVSQLFAEGQDLTDPANRQDLVNVLVERTGVTEAEANQTIDGWAETYQQAQDGLQQARQGAEEAAQTAADAIGTAAIWAFVGLLIGAVIAALGGLVGRPKTLGEARHT